MRLTNIQMENLLHQIEPILQYRNKIGYAVARNTRLMTDALTEYFKFKDTLVKKYGEQVPEEEQSGVFPEYRVSVDSPNFKPFVEEMKQFSTIEHDIDIMTCQYEEVIGVLTGEEILLIDWMLTEKEA